MKYDFTSIMDRVGKDAIAEEPKRRHRSDLGVHRL